ncbi:MAG TPA: hypothetical protein VFN35_34575, partial [Ktedonobacteraceae bacterium]|nr:hypothetical protein [Ktedonobacteraceae bacterium]
MSWQNQMRQSFSDQPASPYPGQVGQPAPLSPIPGSPVPARAHAQKQNAPQISPQAAAAAQAAGLGPLTRTFSSS